MPLDLKAFNPLAGLKGAGLPVAPPTGGAKGPAAGAAQDFLNMVKSAAEEAVKTGQKAESMSVAGVAGQADLMDVVRAVGNAEITLQTVVAVRDKMVNAYQELIRMPI
jgi:flagellar hook-basal body complex protein FliE